MLLLKHDIILHLHYMCSLDELSNLKSYKKNIIRGDKIIIRDRKIIIWDPITQDNVGIGEVPKG
jgi:hypothetical protein